LREVTVAGEAGRNGGSEDAEQQSKGLRGLFHRGGSR